MTAELATTPRFSFEFFPSTKPEDELDFWRVVGNLEPFDPCFFSVTYGALGSARKKSLELVDLLHTHTHTPVAAHLTVVDASQAETDQVLEGLWNHGIRHVVALTGDARCENSLNGYKDALSLIGAVKRSGDSRVTVAAYPETHPAASSPQADIDCLKAKFDAGADDAITQYFFEIETFLEFRDRLEKAGIDKPVVPGILPIHDFFKVRSFSRRCGASIPEQYSLHFAGMEGNIAAQHQLALDFALELCDQLIREGVEDLHFYTLNRSDLVLEIIKQINPVFGVDCELQDVA